MKKPTLLFALLSIVFISGCSQLPKNQIYSRQKSIDWQGNYTRTLPCADCSGIEQLLTLNDDHSFVLHSVYHNKDNDKVVKKGRFKWDNSNSIISLPNNSKLKVSKNKLFVLDSGAQIVKGSLASFYIFNKTPRMVGADRDIHGCIASAGYQWSKKHKRCVRPWLK